MVGNNRYAADFETTTDANDCRVWAYLPANLENSAVATGLENISFHSDPQKRQCQIILKLLHNWN